MPGHFRSRGDVSLSTTVALATALVYAFNHRDSDALPEEDQETQRALMERVLEILLEVENLTANQRAHVQDGLVSIRSDATGTSTNTLTNATADSETLSDLSALISIRYRHQSEEEASAVHIARAHSGNHPANEGNNDPEQGVQPHTPTVAMSEDSERRQLAKKINDIIKASMAAPSASSGESTGLNRRVRWNADKLAAGSTLPAGGTATATGNTANAQATARKAAQTVSVFSCELRPWIYTQIITAFTDCETAGQCIRAT
jgi:hypothetical protein